MKPQKPEISLLEEITKNTKGLELPTFAYKPPDYTDEECIELIRFLPDHVMEHEHGIWLGSGNQPTDKEFTQTIRKNYSYKADWLEYYVLKNTQKLPELTNTEKYQYKPLAEESLATLRLIQEVCAFCHWNNAENLCINRWWLACEWELCVCLLSRSGYTGEALVIGGREAYKNAIEAEQLLDNRTVKTSIFEVAKLTPMKALEGLAWFIAGGQDSANTIFRHTHYANYLKSIKSGLRQLKNTSMNPAYIIDEQFVRMGKGNPQRKRIMK
jgi:hypothetical protein